MIVWLKLKALLDVLLRFRNPVLVAALRFGLKSMPFFLYRIRRNGPDVQMLARPSTKSLSDLFVLRELFIEETYKEILPLLPQRPVKVVDVGANLGSFMVWLHLHRGIERGYCFEPEPTSFQLCRFNLFANGVSGANPVHAAIGGQRRSLRIPVAPDRPGGLSIYGEVSAGAAFAEVDVLALHEWLAEIPGNFDVLKVDCEGAEWEILKHAPREIFSRFNVIVAEVHATSEVPDVSRFANDMEERGFRTVRWDGHSHGVYVGRRDGAGA
jgi:FkbM family methyltransferase